MAGWALGLSLFFCLPVLPAVVALGLAVAVLVRSRRGPDHGRTLALVSLVFSVLSLALWVVLYLTVDLDDLAEALETDTTTRNSDGTVVEEGDVSTTKLQVGDCFDDPQVYGAGDELVESLEVRVVPCDEEHQLEVYHDVLAPDSEAYPGQEALDEVALEECFDTFREFVGKAYARSELELYYYVPLERSWELLGDRTVTCALGDPEALTSGSLRDARR